MKKLLIGLLSLACVFSAQSADRLVVASRLSITQMLPYSLQQQLESTPGVKQATYAAWFGGIYQDQRNFFPNFSVAPNYFDIYKEFEIPKEQVEAFRNTRTGAIVGQSLATQFGWKIGDTIPMQATIFPRGGSNDWPLQLVGIFRSRDRTAASG